ncbi:MAG: NYN domain-containing protein [Candidatus Heimdallarchaeota archaeon]
MPAPTEETNTDLPDIVQTPNSEIENQISQLQTRVAVFWDLENCQPPHNLPGASVIQDLRQSLLEFGSLRQIRAYADLKLIKRSKRLELQHAGVQLLDVPSDKKEAADKMMLTDIMMFAIDNTRPQRIALISGDQDFAYALAQLRNIGYEIILIRPPGGAHRGLRAQADYLLDWQEIIQIRKQETEKLYFEPLLEVLQDLWERGDQKPLLPAVGLRLALRYPAWRDKTGQERLIDYIKLAAHQGQVILKGTHPKQYVTLKKSPIQPTTEISLENRFSPLAAILKTAHDQGVKEIELAAIGLELRAQNPDWQASLAVRKLKDYVLEAQEAGLVSVRPDGLQNYVKSLE